MTESKSLHATYLVPEKLHSRILMLEIVTFLSLVLNLALWFYTGNINSKVDNSVTPATAQTLR